jgi:hypothetical protein
MKLINLNFRKKNWELRFLYIFVIKGKLNYLNK